MESIHTCGTRSLPPDVHEQRRRPLDGDTEQSRACDAPAGTSQSRVAEYVVAIHAAAVVRVIVYVAVVDKAAFRHVCASGQRVWQRQSLQPSSHRQDHQVTDMIQRVRQHVLQCMRQLVLQCVDNVKQKTMTEQFNDIDS